MAGFSDEEKALLLGFLQRVVKNVEAASLDEPA
jgi:hypothetical protein